MEIPKCICMYDYDYRCPKHGRTAWVDGVKAAIAGAFVICHACGGDGKETCDNPDHAWVGSAINPDRAYGCPVCGHDPDHKVKGGGECHDCNGMGVTPAP